MLVCTYAVVATLVLLSLLAGVGAVGVPVRVTFPLLSITVWPPAIRDPTVAAPSTFNVPSMSASPSKRDLSSEKCFFA